MLRLTFITASLVLLVGLSEASAQRVPGFNRRNTVSPYLNLFNANQGGINNYFSFVRPFQEQARFNQRQAAENQFLQQQLNRNQFGGTANFAPGAGGLLRPTNAGIGQPSRAATYFDYSHFYGQPVSAQRTAGGVRRRQ